MCAYKLTYEYINTLARALTYISILAQSQSHLHALKHTFTPHRNTHAHTHALERTTHIYIHIHTQIQTFNTHMNTHSQTLA